MRILFVHERMGSFGGAEANVLATAQALAGRGHAVGLAHRGAPSAEPEWRDTFGERFTLNDQYMAGLQSAGARFRPDLVFVHKISGPGVLEALALSDAPVVRMVHDHDMYCLRGYKYNYFTRRPCHRGASIYCVFPCGAPVARRSGGGFPLRWVSYLAKRREIRLNRRFHRLLVASSYMREELLRNGFSAGQIEIHPPVPRAAAPADTSSFSPRNLIVYSGQVIRGKGVDVLLEALALVQSPFECVILGDGTARAECEKLSVRLGLGRQVTFAGFVPQARVAGHYREASLSVMSSLWPEPFGATGLEAMRCGLPVIAFDVGGIREWLVDGVNGYLVPWMDRAAYAARIDTVLRDKALCRRLGSNGRRMANEQFNFTSYIDRLEGLFRRTVSEIAESADAAALTAPVPRLAT